MTGYQKHTIHGSSMNTITDAALDPASAFIVHLGFLRNGRSTDPLSPGTSSSERYLEGSGVACVTSIPCLQENLLTVLRPWWHVASGLFPAGLRRSSASSSQCMGDAYVPVRPSRAAPREAVLPRVGGELPQDQGGGHGALMDRAATADFGHWARMTRVFDAPGE